MNKKNKIEEKNQHSVRPVNAETDSSDRPDLGTFIGIVIGFGLVITAIIRGGHSDAFININGVLIVLGGTLATTLIAFPSRKVLKLIPISYNAFKPDIHQPADYIGQILNLAKNYRQGGVKTLEAQEELLDNFYLKEGISMVVDGFRSTEIQETLETEISSLKERHQQGQKVLKFMAFQSPVFGMAGTLIGLIQMLRNIQDPNELGPALSVALLTTFYGIMLANLVIQPIAAKLNSRTENEVMLIKAIISGIIGVQKKYNPQKIQRTMNMFLPKDVRG